MNSLNDVKLIGSLGQEPTMKFTPQGTPVTTFSIATNHKYKTNDGELKEEVEWHAITVWNKLAELCNQALSKGSRVFVGGRLHTRSWDGVDGQKHYKTEVVANQVIFLNVKKNNGSNEPTGEESSGDVEVSDVPF